MDQQYTALLLSDDAALEDRLRGLSAGHALKIAPRSGRDLAAVAVAWDAILLDGRLADTAEGRAVLAAADAPVLVVSERNDARQDLDWIRAGAQDVLPLPELCPMTFRRALVHAVGRRQREERRRRAATHDATESAAAVELRRAFEAGQLSLAYQPQVDMPSRAVTGFEALLRWEHPDLGVIYPDMFIPTAEESGLIVPIGRWIIEEAGAALARWQQWDPGLRMAVNVSPRQLECETGERVSQVVARACERHRFAPDRFEVELTESAGILESPPALAEMRELAGLGIGLAVDDFGHGYTSIAYLKRLQLTRLKIDRGFVRSLPWDTRDFLIVESLMHLAGAFGLEVVAEGVETTEQEATLRGLGCRVLQGFLYSRPLGAMEAGKLLHEGRAAA